MTEEKYTHTKEEARRKAKKVLKIVGFTIAGIALFILFGFVLMWLWNWLMPMIFNLSEITYWQAIGIFALTKILFGGFGSSSKSDSDKCSDDNKKSGAKAEVGSDGFGKSVRKEFSREFNKEFDKAFDEEYEKECGSPTEKNEDYDELYEKWWEEKGEKSFAEYMSSKEEE